MDESWVNDTFWIDRQQRMEGRKVGRFRIFPAGESVDLVTNDVKVILLT
jgi:hypothetical protein